MTLKLKVGKKYRDRNGELVEIVDYQADPHYPFIGGNGNNYMESGRWARLSEDHRDLIEEVIEPAQEPARKPIKWAKEAHAYIDGIGVESQSYFSDTWYQANDRINPISAPHLTWRIAVPQWRKDLYAAIKSGKIVEFNHANGVGWVEWGKEAANEFLRHDAGMYMKEEDFRIKPQEVPQWRKDLTQALEDGKVVQVKLFDKWVNTDLDSEYFLYSLRDLVEESYRIKPKPDVVGYCEAANGRMFVGECTTRKCPGDNLKLIWDGETGRITGAEVLK